MDFTENATSGGLKLLEKYENVKVTRLAHGLPMGAQLDYADEMTLFKAFSNRKEVNK